MYAALGLVVTLVCVTIVLTVFKFCSKTYRINKEHNRKGMYVLLHFDLVNNGWPFDVKWVLT